MTASRGACQAEAESTGLQHAHIVTVPGGRGSDPTPVSSPNRRGLVYAVLLAQLLSVALATTGVSSQALTTQGVYAPTTQAFLNYCLLAIVFGTCSILIPLVRQRQAAKAGTTSSRGSRGSSSSTGEDAAAAAGPTATFAQLRRSWHVFAALALIDVEANVLVTRAYQYTSLTSVTLLDCFTIPCVMLLSWLLLRARFTTGHYAGAVCCIAGLAVLVLGDSTFSGSNSLLHSTTSTHVSSTGSSSTAGSAPLLGDSLVLLGAMLYGVCNVTQELLLADVQAGQLLALLGVFGALISGVQAAILEHHMLLSVHWGAASVLLPMAGFAAAMFVFYSLVPQVLTHGGATVLNLSLLSSDGWAALARYLWFGGFTGWSAYFFVASLLMVAGGLVLFCLSGSPKSGGQQGEAPEASAGIRLAASAAGVARAPPAVGAGVTYSRLQPEAELEQQQQQEACPGPAAGLPAQRQGGL